MGEVRVLGVDACGAGWVAVAPDSGTVRAYVGREIGELVVRAERDGPLGVVAVDIPIGLPDSGRRQADTLAREAVGPRRSSVFWTPVREALTAPDHAAAVRANRERTGEGVSAQAFALRRKLLEVDAWVRHAGRPVIEVHPEVSFARMAGGHVHTRKSTWAGVEQRRRLLAAAGVLPEGELCLEGKDVGVDDVLDAAAAAWTARRFAAGAAACLPDPPERFSDGLPAAVWA